MEQIKLDGHMYDVYLTFKDAFLSVSLIENRRKVCDLTVKCYNSRMCLGNHALAFVNMSAINNIDYLLKDLHLNPTLRKQRYGGRDLVEYDFSPLVNKLNKELGRDRMTPGMIDVCDQVSLSTSLIFYAYPSRNKGLYHLVTIDSLNFILDEKHFEKAVKEHNIPVLEERLKEPYVC